MGKTEQAAKLLRRNATVQRVILRTIAAAGILSVAMLAPNALQALALFDGGKIRRKHPKYLIETTFQRLLVKGLITLEETKNGKRVHLTERGRHALMLAAGEASTPLKKKRWDKRWRVVIYDIRERRRSVRIQLQNTLRAFGFIKLQNSVWVYPYDCEELIVLLKADFQIGKEVLYMVVEQIENDTNLKAYFEL